MAESNRVCAHHALVLVLDHEFGLLVHLETDQDDALVDECDFAALVQLFKKCVVWGIEAWFQVAENTMHELAI